MQGQNPSHGACRNTVDVFCGINERTGGTLVEILWERTEHKDPVYGRVLIELPDRILQSRIRGVFRKKRLPDLDPACCSTFSGTPLIRKVIFLFPDPENRKCRGHTLFLQLRDFVFYRFRQRVRHRFSLQKFCHFYFVLIFFSIRSATAFARGTYTDSAPSTLVSMSSAVV